MHFASIQYLIVNEILNNSNIKLNYSTNTKFKGLIVVQTLILQKSKFPVKTHKLSSYKNKCSSDPNIN